jgi:hypothetical protein
MADEVIDVTTTTPEEALQALDPTSAPGVQSAVLDALMESSGQLLGQSLKGWLETGEEVQGHKILMGPAGTVVLVAVVVKTLPPYLLGQGGQA